MHKTNLRQVGGSVLLAYRRRFSIKCICKWGLRSVVSCYSVQNFVQNLTF
jgi:hypothetical protein